MHQAAILCHLTSTNKWNHECKRKEIYILIYNTFFTLAPHPRLIISHEK